MQDREARKDTEQVIPEVARTRFCQENVAAFSDPIGNQDVGLLRGVPMPVAPE